MTSAHLAWQRFTPGVVVREHRAATVMTAALLLIGIGLAIAGNAYGALPIAAAIAISGLVDRRAVLVLSLCLLPGLTGFHPLLAMRVNGSPLDFRLLLTGGLGLALAAWCAVERPRPDPIAGLFAGYVGLVAILTVLNSEAPLRALPVIARDADYFLAYLLARRLFAGSTTFRAVQWAVVIGALAPALSGVAQWIAGAAIEQNDALRLAGLYLTSPVGLAIAVQLGAFAAAGTTAYVTRGHRSHWIAIGLVALFGFVLVETSTRLVFVSFVAGLITIELTRPRFRAVGVIAVLAALVLIASPDLSGRLASTGADGQTPAASAGSSAAPDGLGGSPGSGNDSADGTGRGDTSLQFRLYIWRTMLDEWRTTPILGTGTGTFALRFEERTGIERVAPHNDYLGVLVESGLVGLSLLIGLHLVVVATLLNGLRRMPSGARRDLVASALAIFVFTDIVNAINNPALFVDVQVAVWTFVAVAVGAIADRPDATDVRESAAHFDAAPRETA